MVVLGRKAVGLLSDCSSLVSWLHFHQLTYMLKMGFVGYWSDSKNVLLGEMCEMKGEEYSMWYVWLVSHFSALSEQVVKGILLETLKGHDGMEIVLVTHNCV